jgi:hypothetical protein
MKEAYTVIIKKNNKKNIYTLCKPIVIEGENEVDIINKLEEIITNNIIPKAKRIKLNVGNITRIKHSGKTIAYLKTRLFEIQSTMGLDFNTIFNQ